MKLTQFLPLFFAVVAHADTLNVTTAADTGAGSLRAQIAAAVSGDSIEFTVTGTITLTTGEIAITGKDLAIVGPGAGSLTITTAGTRRALKIVNANTYISGITFNNCKGLTGDVDTGGAIAVDNFSSGGEWNSTTITECVFTNNQSGWGGAVDIFHGGLDLSNCTFSGNSCTGIAFSTNGGGGALSVGPTTWSAITNCTFSGNTQSGAATGQPGGGAIYNYGAVAANPPELHVEHCTFVGNVDASGAAGAIKGNFTGSYRTLANLKNCLLVNNKAPATTLKNFSGNPNGLLTASYASFGGNVTDEAATSAQFMAPEYDKFSSTTLAATVSPTLALNGGITKTHAITRGSPAQRTGLDSNVGSDQRGAPRHANADAGAFELIEPELSVTVSDVGIEDNGTIDFGSTRFDTPIVKAVTITNAQWSEFTTGPLVLANLSVAPGVTISGFPTTPLANEQSATFNVTISSANTGLFNGPLSFTGNDSYNPATALASAGSPNQHTFTLAGIITDTADHWRTTYFGPGATNAGLAADDANPAGDGIVNLLKYSLGLDPLVAYPQGAAVETGFDEQGHLTMTVAKNPAAADVSLAIEASGDLALPSSWKTSDVMIDVNTASLLQAHDTTPITPGLSRFIRLKVTR